MNTKNSYVDAILLSLLWAVPSFTFAFVGLSGFIEKVFTHETIGEVLFPVFIIGISVVFALMGAVTTLNFIGKAILSSYGVDIEIGMDTEKQKYLGGKYFFHSVLTVMATRLDMVFQNQNQFETELSWKKDSGGTVTTEDKKNRSFLRTRSLRAKAQFFFVRNIFCSLGVWLGVRLPKSYKNFLSPLNPRFEMSKNPSWMPSSGF